MKFVKTIRANVTLPNTQKIKICKQSLISKVKILLPGFKTVFYESVGNFLTKTSVSLIHYPKPTGA